MIILVCSFLYTSDTGLQFSFCMMSLPGFGFQIILASQNKEMFLLYISDKSVKNWY